MKKSNSEARVPMRVRAENTATLIDVIDNNYRTVASGVGSVFAELPPGLYALHAQLAEETERRILLLEAGSRVEERVDLAVHSVLPIPGTEPAQDTETERFTAVSRALVRSAPSTRGVAHAGGEVMVVVRDITDKPGTKRARAAVHCEATDFGIELQRDRWDEEVQAPVRFGVKEIRSDGSGTSVARFTAPEGALILRYPGRGNLVQGLWVAAGWCTIVLIPAQDGEPIPGLASIHMNRAGEKWDGRDRDQGELAATSEAILAGLRRGRAVAPPDLLDKLLKAKFENPMLGILGAHALLRQPNPPVDRLVRVLTYIDELLPHHPDVGALKLMVSKVLPVSNQRRRWEEPGAFRDPPLLMASLRGLLLHDATHEGTIKPHSAAETAASRLLVYGPWTTWTQRPPQSRGDARMARSSGSSAARELPTPHSSTALRPGAAAQPSDWRTRLAALRFRDPGVVRVHAFLTELARRSRDDTASAFLESQDRAVLSMNLRQPRAVVERAITRIGAKINE